MKTKVTTRYYVMIVYLDLLSSNCEVMETRLILRSKARKDRMGLYNNGQQGSP